MLKEEKLVCVLKGKDLGIKILMGAFKNINKALEYFCCLESHENLTSIVK